uniref:Rho termination factor-like N-terminal domain-containing protein n=1 Tax=Muribaculaceae bacterium Z82 TaxID=2304548 RepID=A0A7C9JFF7_9BACT
MAALTNQIAAADISKAMDIEFSEKFNKEVSRLAEVLGIFGTEVVPAGTAMYQYEVDGKLAEGAVAEGDEVPLSKYNVTRKDLYELSVKPYRKLTTAQAILKGGYVNAVGRTDDKMVKQLRAALLDEFFDFLGNGTGTAQGDTLQAALAFADAALGDSMEDNGDSPYGLVHFVNRQDIAGYLAKAEVTLQTVFGMSYLQSFLGVEHVFITNKVPQGTIYVTPADNIRIYGVDFASLGQAGLEYTVLDGSLLGVHHTPAYERTSAETYALVGATFMPEVKNYIVKASIGGAASAHQPAALAADEPAKALGDMTVAELKAYAEEHGVDLAGKSTKADILAAIQGAGQGEE